MSLLTNLVSYWKLNETSGTRYDSHGGNHLTDNNTVGQDSNSAKFIAANTEYLSHASNASLQMSSNTDWTICAWVKYGNHTVDQQIITKDDDAANSRDYTIDYASGQGFRVYIKGGATYIANVNVEPNSDGKWYFLMAWYDSSNGQLHLKINDSDTFSDTSPAGATGTDASNAEFRIGAREYAGSEGYFTGSVAGVGIWKRILTAAEQTQMFNGGMPPHMSSEIIPLVASSWFEEQIYDFTVMVKPSDTTKLQMFSTGMASPVATGQESIGLHTANVSNPYAWTDQGQVLTAAGAGWESGGQGLRQGSVIYDSGTYYMYYNSEGGTAQSIGLATSSDGVSWSKEATNPVLTPTGQGRNDGTWVSQPAVIKEGSAWTMIYSYRTALLTLPGYRYATSSDGVSWTKGGSGDILTTDGYFAEYHQILKIGSTYYLIFESGSNNVPFRIYVAQSSSVTGPYENLRPIFTESALTGRFDRYHVATPFIFNNGEALFLYYSGAPDHATPYTTNTWPGGLTIIPLSRITDYPLSATYPFLPYAMERTRSKLGTRIGSRQICS